MMIVDAINTAVTEHALRFLVTAYVESLHHFHRSLGIPASVIELPVGDAEDLARRLATLSANINAPLEATVCIQEARVVFGCALARLAKLECRDTGTACFVGRRAPGRRRAPASYTLRENR